MQRDMREYEPLRSAAPEFAKMTLFDAMAKGGDESPFISVIIPAYNEERMISKCLASLRRVSYPKQKFEIIVVDNGSTDKTREIADSFDAIVLTDETATVSGLRNLGAQKARGELLAFVDADCVVSSEWLSRGAYHFSMSDLVAWGSPPAPPDDGTWVQSAWYLVRQKKPGIEVVEWLESMNLFVRKSHFAKVWGFNEKLVTAEDVDLCYRLSQFGKIISDPRIEVIHLGEAATIREFVRKEIWRGIGNLKGLRSHEFKLSELPSLILPIYFGFLVPAILAVGLLAEGLGAFFPFLLMAFLPSFFLCMKILTKRPVSGKLSHLFILSQFYFLSRTISMYVSFFEAAE